LGLKLLNTNLLKSSFLTFLLGLFFIGLNQVHAERTSGYCSLTEEEKGKEVLSLYPGVEFYSMPIPEQKLRVWIDAWVITTDLYDGLRLMEKTKLYNQDGKLLGKVTLSFNPMKLLEEKDTLTHLVISGYIVKGCSDSRFIAEDDLSKLLDLAQSNEKLSYFKPFLEKYKFIETQESNQYTSYLLVQPNFTQQVLQPRLLLVFYQGELIAIFHTKDVRVKKYDSIEMGSQYKMIYNSKFSEHTKKEMVEIYKNKLNN
jgi:hypothetical protein